jgi:hypothetical protein
VILTEVQAVTMHGGLRRGTHRLVRPPVQVEELGHRIPSLTLDR